MGTEKGFRTATVCTERDGRDIMEMVTGILVSQGGEGIWRGEQ